MARFFERLGVKNAGIYLVSSLISKGLILLALPLITTYLSPTEYGKWSIFATFVVFVTPLSGLMLRYHVARTYYRVSRDLLGKLIFNALLVNAASTLFWLAIAVALCLHTTSSFDLSTRSLLLVPVMAFFVNIQEYVTLVLRFEKRARSYAFFEVGSSVLMLGAVLVVSSQLRSWEGYLIGAAASAALVGLAGISYLITSGHLRLGVDRGAIRDALAVGLPLVPHAIGGAVISLSDRLILEKMLSAEAVGIYSLGYAVGMSLQLFSGAFNKAWSPWVYEQLAAEQNAVLHAAKARIVRYTYWYFLGLGVTATALALAGWVYIRYFIDRTYASANTVLFWVLAGALFQGMYYAIFPYLTHIGRTKIYAVTTLSAAILNVGATILLVRHNGAAGAAQATAVAYAFVFVAIFAQSQRHYPMPWLSFHRKAS